MTTTRGVNAPTALHQDPADRGAEGNERLIAWAGAALFIGFGFEGITILNVHWWLTAHMLIGIALLIPAGIKVASTLYRFVRYYTNSPAYVRKGPPPIVPRIIAPFLVMNTAFVLLSGLVIPVTGSYLVEELHTLSFWTWIVLAGIHVLWYVWRVPRLLLADLAARGTPRSAAFQRIAIVASGGLAGCMLAYVLMPWVRTWITSR